MFLSFLRLSSFLGIFLWATAFADETPCNPKTTQTIPAAAALDAAGESCLRSIYAEAEFEGTRVCIPHLSNAPSAKLMSEILQNKELDTAFGEASDPIEFSLVNSAKVKANRTEDCAPKSYRDFIERDGCQKDRPLHRNACIQILLDRGLLLSTAFLLKSDAGVSEGYSIRCHSQRVVEIFDQQNRLAPKDEMKQLSAELELEDTDLTDLMRHVLALHDIGKPFSVIAGDKESLEEHFSTPLIGAMLGKLSYSKRAQRLAQALVDGHQILGAVLRNRMSPAQASTKFREIVQRGADSFDLKAYLALQEKLYVADAASYPLVCGLLFSSQRMKQEKMCLDNDPLPLFEMKDGAYLKIRKEILQQ